jgi:hypothetical protein
VGFRLGVATYSLREFQRGLAIRMVKQLGVTQVSVKAFHLPYTSRPAEITKAVSDFTKAGFDDRKRRQHRFEIQRLGRLA